MAASPLERFKMAWGNATRAEQRKFKKLMKEIEAKKKIDAVARCESVRDDGASAKTVRKSATRPTARTTKRKKSKDHTPLGYFPLEEMDENRQPPRSSK